MKKQLLLICFLLVNSIIFGQTLSQPSQFNSVCDDNNDGFAMFYMQEISFEIIGNNPSNLVVTHHLSQLDASTGNNPLPNNYTNTTNPQLIFARVVDTLTTQFQIIVYYLTVNPAPNNNAFTFQGCDTDNLNDGITFFPELSFFDNNFNQNGQHTISYYFNSFDAQNATNALPSNVPFQNTTPQMQLLFVRVVNPITGCFSIAQLFLAVQNCNQPVCTAPTTLNVSSITQYSAQLSWASTSNSFFNVYITLAGLPAPSANTNATGTTSTNIFTETGLTCATAYQFYVKKVCPNSISSEWVGPFSFSTSTCTQEGGQPQDMYQCGTGVTACFNLTQNDANILGTLNPAQYQITYHNLFTDAETGNNPIQTATQYCITFAEQIFTRLLNLQDNTYVVASFGVYFVDAPPAPTQNLTVCGNETTGSICVNLASLIPNLSSGGTFDVTFYETQANASSGTNAIQNPSCYPLLTMLPTPLPVYYRIENTSSGCSSVGIVNLFVVQCNPICLPPPNTTANVSANIAVFIWTPTNASMYEVYLGIAGTPGPIQSTVPTGSTIGTTYSFTGLQCNSVYQFYVRSVCNANDTSLWSAPFTITTFECNSPGQPTNLIQCSDDGSACFNLNDNNNLILGTLNPLEYSITYHISQSDASLGNNPINTAQPFCTNSSTQVIFARLLNLTTNQTQIFTFQLITQSVNPVTLQLQYISQCDNNYDGLVVFDLTSVQIQLNNTGSLSFYMNYQDALAVTNPIANPTNYTLAVVSNSLQIFVRVDLPGCDSLYNLLLIATPNCNVSSTCINANSLCDALGAPFINTQNLNINEPGANYGCLFSHPNPTWFYLPVSSPGTINLKIEQYSNINFTGGNILDVDYIVYGPFTSPTAPCYNALTSNNIVSCSYSPTTIEFPTINNAQTGQYYLIMTTNYSNNPGYIRITETANSQGGINCSGIRLNAFLDSNSNGTKDVGESNFPLGQFQIEKNNDGNVHNITAPSGVYNLYDETASNSYDLGYTIEPAYSAAYVLTTASYSNISPVIGGGMQVYNFPITVVQSYQDIAVSIIPIDQPRAGFIYSNKIVYGNFGNQTIAAGTVTFTKDAALTIMSNSQLGTTPSANGFSYNFTNLLPFEVRTMIVTMQVPPIPVVNLGQLLTNNATIIPLVGDVVPENNSSTLSVIITGSYDPNDKVESHGDKILTSSFATTDYLYYTIRFENTGTASAINVRISDLLDPKLDETSIKMVSASHDYVLDRLDNNLVWRFDNILLPPSVENTNTGKGYVTFKVKPKAGYATGDIIPNTAGIYFDFNPVIVTNTFLTEFVATLAVNEFENSDFIFYPNPVQDMLNITLKNNANNIELIEVYDALGKSMLRKKATTPINSDSIDLTQLASGLYFIEVTTTNQLKVIKKVMRK